MTGHSTRPPKGDDFGILSRDLPFMARTLQSLLRPEGHAIRQALDLEAGVIGVLSVIWLNPGISQNDLATSVVLKKSAVTALVKHLEERGLVARERSQQDRRQNALTLTADGHTLIAKIREHTEALNDRLFENVSAVERETFFAVMDKVVQNLLAGSDR